MTTRRIIALDAGDVSRALSQLPLLEGCSPRELERISSRAHVLSFAGGEVIVPEGEEGLGFYLILSGFVRVVRGAETIRRLGKGEFFGEVALLQGRTRTASVIADGPVTCLGILRSFFKPLLVRNPRIALRILEEEARRAGESGEPGW